MIFRKETKIKFGEIDTAPDKEMLAYFKEDLPDFDLVLSFLDTVNETSVRWNLPTNYVLRDRGHLAGWIESFLRVERKSLSERFSNEFKSFESWVIASRSRSQVVIKVRLMTMSVSGYTEYNISIVKMDEDEYLCVE